jgi:hypothetical protein
MRNVFAYFVRLTFDSRGFPVVSFSNNATVTNSAVTNSTVTFVPFFAALPNDAVADDAAPAAEELGRPVRLGVESDRPETDRAIALKVAHALAALQVPILRTLEVSVHEGNVTLRGRVRTYYERQLANTHAKRTPGVRSVRGEISVAG